MTYANLPRDFLRACRSSWPGSVQHAIDAGRRHLPGVALCGAVTLAAFATESLERHVFGHARLEALVLAIVVGTAIRSLWTPGARWQDGIGFSAKTLLEVAVMLLGASLSFRTLADIGPGLLFGIAGVVALVICGSFAIGRLLGLPKRMAILVACGNSICGNSAIAAVAPVIGANGDDIAASIAFTAVLGVLVVIGLPLLVPLVGFSATQFGVFAGLTVYAVPQVIAATAPIGTAAVQLGTLVKLVRVLMLGPVVLVLSVLTHRFADEPAQNVTAGDRPTSGHVSIRKMVPWFIIAFLALATLHSLALVPRAVLAPTASLANVLTILSMAALGLGVDIRVVARAGGRVTAAACASLVLLGLVSLALMRGLGVA